MADDSALDNNYEEEDHRWKERDCNKKSVLEQKSNFKKENDDAREVTYEKFVGRRMIVGRWIGLLLF